MYYKKYNKIRINYFNDQIISITYYVLFVFILKQGISLIYNLKFLPMMIIRKFVIEMCHTIILNLIFKILRLATKVILKILIFVFVKKLLPKLTHLILCICANYINMHINKVYYI